MNGKMVVSTNNLNPNAYKNAKGYLRPEEREYLHHIAAHAGLEGVILNIGTEYGASLVCFRLGNVDCTIIGMDLDNTKAPDGLGIVYVTGDSSKLFEVVSRAYPIVDVLFIDGDHTYQGVLADTAYTQLIDIGGYVIFHDCYDFHRPRNVAGEPRIHDLVPGVNQAVSEWYETFNGCWSEHGSVGTMRIFKRLSCV